MNGKPYVTAIVVLYAVFAHGVGWAQTLSGRVYEGQTGSEPPGATAIEGVTVSLYGSNNGSDDGTANLPIQTTTTNSEGWYSLTARGAYDFYNIVQTNKAGYVDSTPSPAATTVGGTVKSSNWIQYRYEDIFVTPVTMTGNKFWDGQEGQPPANNPPVAVDDLATTPQDTPVDIHVLSNDSDPDGDPLHINTATDPPHGAVVNHGTHVTYTPDSGFTGSDTFDYTAGDGRGGTDTATVTITVSASDEPWTVCQGIKWNDLNGDGNRDAAEPGLPGWTVYLDTNTNGQWDSGEPSDTTDGQGNFDIRLQWGPPSRTITLIVREIMQEGWKQTSPVSEPIVSFSSSQMQTILVDFGNHETGAEPPLGTGTLDGYKRDADTGTGLENWRIYVDLNANGRWDSGEPNDLTDGNGYYRMPDVEPGTYRVCEEMQAGWQGDQPCVEGVAIIAGITTTQDFYNSRIEPPQTQTLTFAVCFDIEMTLPDGSVHRLSASGPAVERVSIGPNGEAADTNGNGLDDVPAELISLQLAGIDPVLGSVTMTLNPAIPSTGRIEERVNNTAGVLDISPFTTSGSADSFFDVWFQIELPTYGMTVLGGHAKRVEGVINHLLPGGNVYSETSPTTVDLLDQNGQPTGVRLGPIAPCGSAPPSAGCDYGDAPPSYGIASHDIAGIRLGALVDGESSALFSAGADGDDLDNVDDEDGVTFLSDLVRGQSAGMHIAFTFPLQQPPKYVAAWVDFNQDGVFQDPTERISWLGGSAVVGPTFGGIGGVFAIPATATLGSTFMRVRAAASSNPSLGPTGHGGEGEVEDYQVTIKADGLILPPGGIFGGIKFNDLNGNGHRDPGEPGLANWAIWIDLNGNGVKDTGEETLTNPDGSFFFTALAPGTYTVHEELQSGWTQTCPGGPGTHTVNIQGGQPVPSVVFGNQRTGGRDYGDAPLPYPEASHLLGGPYLGLFGDAPDAEPGMQRDAQAIGDDNDAGGDDENGLLSVNLVKTPGTWSTWAYKGYFNSSADAKCGFWIDFNGDGDWDDPNELWIQFGFCGFGTGPQDWFHVMGAFQLPADAKVGTTYVRLRVYDDCNVAVSPSGAGGPGEVEDHQVEIKADGPGVPPGGIVHGYKWNDINGSGLWDILNPVEPPLAGWTIWLDTNGSGKQDAGDMTTQTDAQGHFRFTGVPAGTYTLGEQLQPGWTQTTPGGAGTYAVTVQPGQGTFPQMFGNRQSGGPTSDGQICGSKWNDLNGNAIWDLGEPYLSGWTVYLDTNHNGRLDPGEPAQVTDVSGAFLFTGLAAGSYAVAEQMQAGWQQTWPGPAATHTINIQPGGVPPACVMFGNQQGDGPSPALQFDWGDAPDPTYPTLRVSNGAYHVIAPGFHLGQSIDGEPDGQSTPDALGDDHFDADDEDGVIFLTPILPGGTATLEITVSAAGFVDAWIDFDGDGTWSQAGDQILTAQSVTAGVNALTIAVPAPAQSNAATFARFRLSHKGGLPAYGPAQDGEVEDYHILLGEDGPYVPGEGERPHVKWSQPPVEIDPNIEAPPVFCGWNEAARSTQYSDGRRQWRMDADDFHCLGPIPITRIRWWGGYKGWDHPELPESQPVAWHIGFWANQVEGLEPGELYPERLVWFLEIPNERVGCEPVGLCEFPQKFPEMGFLHEVRLEPAEWFRQSEFESDADIFWISVTAIYPPDAEAINQWGWMTRPHVWGRGAVMPAIMGEWPTYDERLSPGGIYPVENPQLCGQNHACDLCFELLTEQPWVKWDQPFRSLRDWPHYEDLESQGTSILQQENLGRMVADDWFCESDTPVIAVAWWGSYIGHGYEACRCQTEVQPPRPDYFLLQIRTERAGQPGDPVWEYRAFDYDEVLVGCDRHPEGEPNEPVFRYTVRLAEENRFRPEGPGQTYWLSITAIYADPLPMITHSWGWTSHAHAFESGAAFIDYRSAAKPQWRPLVGPEDQPIDMSFTLFTVSEPPWLGETMEAAE